MDIGYDFLDVHLLLFKILHQKTLVQLIYGAQLSKVGSEKAITKQVNILWGKCVNPKLFLTGKLIFLCKNCKFWWLEHISETGQLFF